MECQEGAAELSLRGACGGQRVTWRMRTKRLTTAEKCSRLPPEFVQRLNLGEVDFQLVMGAISVIFHDCKIHTMQFF